MYSGASLAIFSVNSRLLRSVMKSYDCTASIRSLSSADSNGRLSK